MDRFHQDLLLETANSDDDDDSSDFIEKEFRKGSNLEDIFFQDLSPGKLRKNKLIHQILIINSKSICRLRLTTIFAGPVMRIFQSQLNTMNNE